MNYWPNKVVLITGASSDAGRSTRDQHHFVGPIIHSEASSRLSVICNTKVLTSCFLGKKLSSKSHAAFTRLAPQGTLGQRFYGWLGLASYGSGRFNGLATARDEGR